MREEDRITRIVQFKLIYKRYICTRYAADWSSVSKLQSSFLFLFFTLFFFLDFCLFVVFCFLFLITI